MFLCNSHLVEGRNAQFHERPAGTRWNLRPSSRTKRTASRLKSASYFRFMNTPPSIFRITGVSSKVKIVQGDNMQLNDNEEQFIEKRRRLAKIFPIVGGVMFALIICYLIWAYLRTPMLVNPYAIKEKIMNNTIQNSTLTLMSMMLPIAIWALFTSILVLIGFMFSWNAMEKKYLRIIERITRKTSNREDSPDQKAVR